MSNLPPAEIEKLTRLKDQLIVNQSSSYDGWRLKFSKDKSLLHNIYLNLCSNKYGQSDRSLDIDLMITSPKSALTPYERRRMSQMILDLGSEKTLDIWLQFFSTVNQLSVRSWMIDERYLRIKRSIYYRFHGRDQERGQI